MARAVVLQAGSVLVAANLGSLNRVSVPTSQVGKLRFAKESGFSRDSQEKIDPKRSGAKIFWGFSTIESGEKTRKSLARQSLASLNLKLLLQQLTCHLLRLSHLKELSAPGSSISCYPEVLLYLLHSSYHANDLRLPAVYFLW